MTEKGSKRVLIIEDEPDVAETMKKLTEKGGYEAEFVLDPRKGLEIAKNYDLVLLDLMMPVMSGREFLDEIPRRGIKTPIIVVSAVGLSDELKKELSVKYPRVGFVAKTDMHTDLVKAIKNQLECMDRKKATV